MQTFLTSKLVKPAIIVGSIILLILIIMPIFSGTYNRVITLEENVNVSLSNENKEQQRRIDLFNNLADAVISAKNFEQDTLTKIAEARSQANKGQVDQAMLTIASVVEAYPEIKSIALYDKAMTEFAITENRLAGYREQYNNDVRAYQRKVRSFPTNIILAIMGYEKRDYKYIDYEIQPNAHRDLFT